MLTGTRLIGGIAVFWFWCGYPAEGVRWIEAVVLTNPAVSVALVGTARTEELESALGYANKGALGPEILADIGLVTVNDRSQLNPGTWPSDMGAWQRKSIDE